MADTDIGNRLSVYWCLVWNLNIGRSAF